MYEKAEIIILEVFNIQTLDLQHKTLNKSDILDYFFTLILYCCGEILKKNWKLCIRT